MTVDYMQVIRDSREHLKLLLKERDGIDAKIKQIVIALRALVRLMPEERDRQELLAELKAVRRKEPTLMEAITEVLKKSQEAMSGAEVRQQMEDAGFDLSDYSQPTGTVMTTLNRMAESGRVKRAVNKDKTVTYRWAGGKAEERGKK